MLIRHCEMLLAALVGSILGASGVAAQEYPNKPLRLVTTPAGAGNDLQIRQILPGLTAALGQPVIVDNRGITQVTVDIVKAAPPDGYSLLVSGTTLWILPLLQKMSYDAVKDFAPVTLISTEPNVLLVRAASPVSSVKDLIALAKSKPGALNYGSAGAGTSSQLAMELLKYMSGTNVVYVPFKGAAPALAALIGDEVQMAITGVGISKPLVAGGRLKNLAVTSAKQTPLVPGVPTIAESGLPGFEWVGMTGIWAPAKTPPAIIKKLNEAAVRLLRQPEMKERFLSLGFDIVGNSPEEFDAIIKSDNVRMQKLIKETGIKMD